MALVLDGTNGVSLVQDGVVTAADLAAGAVSGNILQTQTFVPTTHNENSSTTFADSLVTVNITPSSTSSKILILTHSAIQVFAGARNDTGGITRLVRVNNGTLTQLASHSFYNSHDAMGSSNAVQIFEHDSYTVLDSPATTNELTYKIQMKVIVANAIRYSKHYTGDNEEPAEITVMEIAG